jgi:hypothetical protein
MDAQRLKAIVHHICVRSRERARSLTVPQLHEILWRADGETYVRLGRAIVDEEYVRQVEGPHSIHLESAINELTRAGRLEIQSAQSNTQVEHVLAHGTPDIAFLSENERHILDEVIEHVARTAHDFAEGRLWELRDSGEGYGPVAGHTAAWKAAAIGERIAFQQQLLEPLAPLTQDDAEWVASELRDRR